MYYKELLRVRRFFIVFALTVTAIGLLVVLFSGHAKVSVGDSPSPHYALAAQHVRTGDKQSESGSTQVYAPGIEISNEPSEPLPFSALLAIAGFVAAIFGTCVGTSLSCENHGHLEIAWTRPASRIGYAARLMAVDVAGIIAIFAYTLALCVAAIYAAGWLHYIVVDGQAGVNVVRFLLYALAWFALVAGLTASVRSRGGTYVAGFSWLVMALLLVLMDLSLPPALHALVKGLNYLNPLLYGSYSSGAEAARHVAQIGSVEAMIGLGAIIVLGIVAALTQWRVLEA
jgi:hypothetical protein